MDEPSTSGCSSRLSAFNQLTMENQQDKDEHEPSNDQEHKTNETTFMVTHELHEGKRNYFIWIEFLFY